MLRAPSAHWQKKLAHASRLQLDQLRFPAGVLLGRISHHTWNHAKWK